MEKVDGIDGIDRKLLLILQNEFPVGAAPFCAVAQRLSLTEKEVLRRVKELKRRKLIRRIGAVFDQAALGYKSALATMSVPESLLERVASYVSGFREVTHNYSRRHRLNLWFTITASSEERIAEIAQAVEEFSGCPVHLLKARRTFKVRAVFEIQ